MGVAIGQAKANVTGTISGDITNTSNNVVLSNAVASAVPASVETTVATYTTSATKATWITKIFVSGQENSKWRLFIGGTARIVRRIGAGQVNGDFIFETPLKVAAGSVPVDVKVTHFVVGQTPDFEASILGYVEV